MTGMDPPWLMAPSPSASCGVVGTLLQDGWGGRTGEFAQGSGSRHQNWDLIFTGAKWPSRALICVCWGLSTSPGAPGAFDLLLLEQMGIWGFSTVLRDPC